MLFSSTQPSLRARVLTRFPAQVLAGAGIAIDKTGGKYTFSVVLTPSQRARSLPAWFDSAVVGAQLDVFVPFSCTVKKAILLANTTGDVVVDIWKAGYVDYPPTPANSICGSTKPTISNGTKMQDAALVGWTTSIVSGEVLRFNIDSLASITRLAASLEVEIVE